MWTLCLCISYYCLSRYSQTIQALDNVLPVQSSYMFRNCVYLYVFEMCLYTDAETSVWISVETTLSVFIQTLYCLSLCRHCLACECRHCFMSEQIWFVCVHVVCRCVWICTYQDHFRCVRLNQRASRLYYTLSGELPCPVRSQTSVGGQTYRSASDSRTGSLARIQYVAAPAG